MKRIFTSHNFYHEHYDSGCGLGRGLLVEALQACPCGEDSLVVGESIEGVLAVIGAESTVTNTTKGKTRHYAEGTKGEVWSMKSLSTHQIHL